MIHRLMISMILFLFLMNINMAQTSLWQDRSPYGNSLRVGDLVEIRVQETFNVDIDSKWTLSNKIELNLVPDTKNLPFLSSSEQSKNRNRDSQAKYRIKDKLDFSLQAVIGQPQQGSDLYPIQARRAVIIDLKPTQINLSGLVHPKYVKNDMIHSKHIAELQLNVKTEPPPNRDNSINLKPPRPEEITDPQNPPPSRAELSEQEKQTLLLRHLQEIIGILNN